MASFTLYSCIFFFFFFWKGRWSSVFTFLQAEALSSSVRTGQTSLLFTYAATWKAVQSI